MLFSLGHGQHIVADKQGGLETGARRALTQDAVSLAQVVPEADAAEAAPPPAATFGYLFPDAPADGRPDLAPKLDALAATMIEPEVDAGGDDAAGDSDIPPIFTYLGQFIDHDITANTDRDAPEGAPVSIVTGDDLAPLPRDEVVAKVVNLRQGALNLDSLYGDGPTETAFSAKWKAAMRDPADRARMRIGDIQVIPVGEVIPVPDGTKGDLPRLGDAIDDPASGLTAADIEGLPEPLRSSFFDAGELKRWMALIGDARNDENLIVAQLHLAFLRFHNAVADSLKPTVPNPELRFAEARKRTTWVYQWLVVNAFLKRVCDPAVVERVKSEGARLYTAFRERVAPNGPELPLPLEFSVAGFRFGHSMVRGAYDHNRNFGRPARPDSHRGASFRELFSFTGMGRLGQAITGQTFERLVSNWPIEWDRFVADTPAHNDRMARKIDTNLAHPLSVLLNAGEGEAEPIKALLKMLAARNLRRGYRLSLPTAQEAIRALNAFDAGGYGYPEPMPTLPPEKVCGGSKARGAAVKDCGFDRATPLWFYVLREAECGGGNRLGPLGSRLVAETLIGLAAADPDSYWHAAAPGAWTPAEMPVGGGAVDSLSAMLRAAGLLATESEPEMA